MEPPKVYVRREDRPKGSMEDSSTPKFFRVNNVRPSRASTPEHQRPSPPVRLPSSVTVRVSRPVDVKNTPSLETSSTASPSYKYRVPAVDANVKVDRRIEDLEISNKSLLSVNKYLEKRIRAQQDDINRMTAILKNKGNNIWEERDFPSATSSPDLDWDEETFESDDKIDQAARRRTVTFINNLKSTEEADKALHQCIYATERLIKDAMQAINYNVRTEDVKLGGRVVLDEYSESESESESEDKNENNDNDNDDND